jgi:2-dehydropantoate 2-reductase
MSGMFIRDGLRRLHASGRESDADSSGNCGNSKYRAHQIPQGWARLVSMRILVLGAGAIGGYFGGRLAASGSDVTFLVRPRRRAQLQQDGLRVVSPHGDLTMPVKTVTAEELAIPDSRRAIPDIVLLTCKSYDLPSAMDSIAPAIAGDCAIVPMLNGMAHIDLLGDRFGRRHVMGGTCSISAALDANGVIRHATPFQRIAFGELDKTETSRARGLAEAFAKTSVEWELAADIMQNMWEKIYFLSVAAATNCLFRSNMGEINRAPGGPEAIRRALTANAEIAKREGHPLRPVAIEFANKTLLDPASTLRGSMLHDLESGAPVEADHIIGWLLAKAREHGVDDTVLSHAYTSLKAYEARRSAPNH